VVATSSKVTATAVGTTHSTVVDEADEVVVVLEEVALLVVVVAPVPLVRVLGHAVFVAVL
jgi:hypothetical protein